MSSEETHGIVIVGGGICGLATALALHRKGLSSVVLERSDVLRAAGLAIGVYSNGWRALDQLGLGNKLRKKAIRLSKIQDPILGFGAQREILLGKEELRCLRRSDLIESLADHLPPGSIRFGCRVVAIGEEPGSSFPTIHLHDGSMITAKVLIGCDGVNSVVAKSLGLQDRKFFHLAALRGFTHFPENHGLKNTFVRTWRKENVFGMLPIDEKLVHWFVAWKASPIRDEGYIKDPDLMKQAAQAMVQDLPECIKDTVKKSDSSSLISTHIPYRAPWALLTGTLVRGSVTVAGDAMHVMGPFLGQGGSSGLEDAVVLARNLSKEVQMDPGREVGEKEFKAHLERALEMYVKERKLRVLLLSTQTFLMGTMLQSSSKVVKLVILVVLAVAFGGYSMRHVRYDCGEL